MRHLRPVLAVDRGALEGDLEVGERRVHVVVLVVKLMRLRHVVLESDL